MPEWTPLTGIDNYVEGTPLRQAIKDRLKEEIEKDKDKSKDKNKS